MGKDGKNIGLNTIGVFMWGRNRIDRCWSLQEVNANDNVAQPKFMKKRNSFARKRGFTKGMALAA